MTGEQVSVVIPTHNRGKMLAHAIESALAQTWAPLEIIIIDDASSDGTAALLHRLSETDSRIRYISSPHPMGGARARNEGIKAAKGKYVAFLDDDDVWSPGKLEAQIDLLVRHPKAVAVSCGYVKKNEGLGTRHVRVAPSRNEQHLLQINHLGGASMCLATKNALEQVGGFDAGLRSCQDWDIWVKLQKISPVLVCDRALVRYWVHRGARITTNLLSAYTGRRRFYFLHRKDMSLVTRSRHIGELLFLRQKLRQQTIASIVLWFSRTLVVTGLAHAVHLGLRYGKFRMQRCFAVRSGCKKTSTK